MKNKIIKISLFTLVAAALLAAPVAGRADTSTNAPAVKQTKSKHSSVPFKGKVVSVDASAMTFSTANMTIAITSATKISKDGKPAEFADIAVGTTAKGSYKKDANGKLNATSVSISAGKKKGKTAPADN